MRGARRGGVCARIAGAMGSRAAVLGLFFALLPAGCRGSGEEEEPARAEEKRRPGDERRPDPAERIRYPASNVYPQNAVAEFYMNPDDPDPIAVIPLAHGGRANLRGPVNGYPVEAGRLPRRVLARIRLFAPPEVTLRVFQARDSYDRKPFGPSLDIRGSEDPEGVEVGPEALDRAGLAEGIHSVEWRVHGVLPDGVQTLRTVPPIPEAPVPERAPVPPWQQEEENGEEPAGAPPAGEGKAP